MRRRRIVDHESWREARKKIEMSDWRTVYEAMAEVAAMYGWATAVAEKRQEDPEQWELIVTKQDPAAAIFGALGVRASDGLQAGDVFGGDDDG